MIDIKEVSRVSLIRKVAKKVVRGATGVAKRELSRRMEEKDLCKNYNDANGYCEPGCHEEQVRRNSSCPFKGLGKDVCKCYRK